MKNMKYEVSVIDSDCKFYKLNDVDGERLATIEFAGWKFYKYNVSFSYKKVENNLAKERNFRTLAEAKKYVAEVLAA